MAKKRDKAPAWTVPMHNEALAVHPSEIKAAKEIDRGLGLGDTEYDREGCPVFRSKGQYDKFLKAHGYVNKTSGKGHHALCPTLLKRIQERIAND